MGHRKSENPTLRTIYRPPENDTHGLTPKTRAIVMSHNRLIMISIHFGGILSDLVRIRGIFVFR